VRVLVKRFLIVPSSEERRKHLFNHRVLHRHTAGVQFEILLSHIGRVLGTIHDHVIPRLVTVRLGLVALIPHLIRPAGWVSLDDDTAIPVAPVMNHIADPEPLAHCSSVRRDLRNSSSGRPINQSIVILLMFFLPTLYATTPLLGGVGLFCCMDYGKAT